MSGQLPSVSNLRDTKTIPYDPASPQSRIPSSVLRKRESPLPSFGEKLRLEREKRKISLEQISSSTKIGTRMLQALEDDKFSQLPGGIFNKGFVRAYARVVGLDEDQIVADYLLASGEGPRPELVTRDGVRDAAAEETASRQAAARGSAARNEENRIRLLEATSDAPSRPLPWGIFAIVLLIIALTLSLWSHRRREQERLAVHPAAKTETQSKPANSQGAAPGAPVPSTPSTTQGAKPSSSTGGAGAGAPAEKPPATTSQTTTKSDQATPQASLPFTQSSAPISPGEFQVLIHAREQSWVSVVVDGKSPSSEVLEAGTDRTFSARNRVYIKTGNSGALDFQLNGKKLDVGGGYGEVKSVTIGHSGVIPTPAQAATNP
jgi:cytoskeleton protein RodZ